MSVRNVLVTVALLATSLLSAHENLRRTIATGDAIRPWLILGPIYDDVSAAEPGPTFQRTLEKPGPGVPGWKTALELRAEAEQIFRRKPHEGMRDRLRGQPLVWRLERDPSRHVMWGAHFPVNHLTAAVFATVLEPARPGRARFRLTTKIHDMSFDAIVGMNGKVVCDTLTDAPARKGEIVQHEFTVDLKAGPNAVMICPHKTSMGISAGFRLELLDGEATVHVALAPGVDFAARSALEAEVESLELSSDIVEPGREVLLKRRSVSGSGARMHVRVEPMPLPFPRFATDQRQPAVKELLAAGEKIAVCRGDDLVDGRYRLWCEWESESGQPVTNTSYEIFKHTPTPPLPGHDNLAERKRRVLENYASNRAEGDSRHEAWRQLAIYESGRYRDVSTMALEAACEYIDAGADSSDFVIQVILRLLSREAKTPRLAPAIRERMKRTILRFRYWTDEPVTALSVRNLASENHKFAWHVAEFLAGQLYPAEKFTNSGESGLFHALKGRMFIMEWINQRGRFGFDEWHSDVYSQINLAILANVRDFILPEDYPFRQAVETLIEYICFNLAADGFEGVFGTPHNRTTAYDLMLPQFQQSAQAMWLLFGKGDLLKSQGSRSFTGLMAAVTLASSPFKLPKIISDIATDRSQVVYSRIRQGKSSTVEGELRLRHANLAVFRTPDYTMSALQDCFKGRFGSQVSTAQVTLKRNAVLFWSAPNTIGKGVGLRPDYWSGSLVLPRVIQHRNVMSLTWRLTPYAGMSHCFLEPSRFDEVRYAGNWAFARVEDGYVGVYSTNGYRHDVPGEYRGRELVCHSPQNTWLAECGRKADWGSFDKFVSALTAARVDVAGETVAYHSPSAGKFVTGWDVTPTVDGQPIRLRGFPLVESEWGYSEFGSGLLTIRYGGEERELWFP
jgi:hypothetical protein